MANIIRQIAQLRGVEDRMEVTVSGIVTGLKEITTQSGHMMGFATLEDESGNIDIVIFSDKYATVAPLLESDDPLIINGLLEVSEQKMRIQVHDKGGVYRDILMTLPDLTI